MKLQKGEIIRKNRTDAKLLETGNDLSFPDDPALALVVSGYDVDLLEEEESVNGFGAGEHGNLEGFSICDRNFIKGAFRLFENGIRHDAIS